MKSLKIAILSVLAIVLVADLHAQNNDTPNAPYDWKKNKTEFQDGYVVLRSGKRMDGKISLRGSADKVSAVQFESEGKYLNFPPGALKSYGLTVAGSGASSAKPVGPINESPESMYEWKSQGVVMNKEIFATTPRPGYLLLRDGTRYEGELRLRMKAGEMDDFEIRTASGREKVAPWNVERYGYTISEAEVAQQELKKQVEKTLQGTIITNAGTESGKIDIIGVSGKPYVERIFFVKNNGTVEEHTTKSISGFSVIDKKGEAKYVVVDNVFVEEGYDGSTFQMYVNPKPTTVDEWATSLTKVGVGVVTSTASSEILSADQRKNNYTSNIDSIISASSADQLIELREKLAALGGYKSSDEAMESDNESLKANIGAINVALAGKQIQESDKSIYYREWIILNKKNKETLMVYRAGYDKQILNLLMGCEAYLMLSKSEQKEFTKWDNVDSTLKFLDACY